MCLNISRYALQIEQYMPHFPRDRLMIIESKDLRDNRETTLHSVFEFLGVDEGWAPPNMDREFYRSAERQMKPAVLRIIERIPNVRQIGMYVPGPIKSLKHRLTDGLPSEELNLERAVLTQDLEQRLQESLREDVARFRTYMGDDFDGWGIA